MFLLLRVLEVRGDVCFPVTRCPEDLVAVRAGEGPNAWGEKKLFRGTLTHHASQTDAGTCLAWSTKKKAMKMQHMSVHDIPKPVQIRNMNLEQKQRSNFVI